MKSAIEQQFEKTDSWGILASVDLHDCNPETIRSAEKIKQFVYELCDRIKVTRFGECLVVNFGEDPRVSGFSMAQLIETSLISGHFANRTNTVYLDAFSCKFFDPNEVAEFAKSFFEAKDYILHTALRK